MFILTFYLLFSQTYAQNSPNQLWQGYGNISASNLTDIWYYINNNLDKVYVALQTQIVGEKHPQALQQFVTGFSDYLNKLWAPAWNVMTIFMHEPSKNAVCYGYAFNDHWMWYNGYILPGKSYPFAFILWKEYNCINWVNIGDLNTTKGFSTKQKSQIDNFMDSFQDNSVNDIWVTAKLIVDTIPTLGSFSGDHAYSIIASQSAYHQYFGRVCIFETNHHFGSIVKRKEYGFALGYYFLFQTR